jgi:hypothetical protein
MQHLRQDTAVRTQRQPLEGAHQPALPPEPADGQGRDRRPGGESPRLHALPAHPLGQGLIFVAAGAALFLVCLAVQYLAYSRVLLKGLKSAVGDEQKRGLKRWAAFVIAWQALLLVGLAVYAVEIARERPHGLAWLLPPLAAIAGTLLPLQLAVGRILRAAIR